MIHSLPLALALAGAAGLRAFLPLFYLCLAITLGLVHPQQLNPHFLEWFEHTGSDAVLPALGALALLEMVAEAVPAVAMRIDLAVLLLRIPSALLCAFAATPLRDLGDGLGVAAVAGFLGALSVLNLQVRHVADGGPLLSASAHLACSLLLCGICLAVVSVSLQKPYAGLLVLYGGTWGLTVLTQRWGRAVRKLAEVASLRPAPEMPTDLARRTRYTPQH